MWRCGWLSNSRTWSCQGPYRVEFNTSSDDRSGWRRTIFIGCPFIILRCHLDIPMDGIDLLSLRTSQCCHYFPPTWKPRARACNHFLMLRSLSLQQTRNCVHECTHFLLGRETNLLLESLVQRISIKWDKPLGQTTGWLRTRLSSHKSLLAWFSHQVEKRSWNRRWCRAAGRVVKI